MRSALIFVHKQPNYLATVGANLKNGAFKVELPFLEKLCNFLFQQGQTDSESWHLIV